MRGGPSSSRWWWSEQKLSLGQEMGPPTLVQWEQWGDQQTSKRKVPLQNSKMMWHHKERPLQIPEEQSTDGTLKIHDSWWDNNADEEQQFTDSSNFKEFFSSLRAVYGLSYPNSISFLSSKGITLSNTKETWWWREHFPTYLTDPLPLTLQQFWA